MCDTSGISTNNNKFKAHECRCKDCLYHCGLTGVFNEGSPIPIFNNKDWA